MDAASAKHVGARILGEVEEESLQQVWLPQFSKGESGRYTI
jgi:hypothetical protein